VSHYVKYMRDIAVTNMRRHSSSKKHPWDEAPRAGHLQGTPTHHSQAELQAGSRKLTCPLQLPLHGVHRPLEERIPLGAPHCATAKAAADAPRRGTGWLCSDVTS
jgi:hypothetical protein